MTIRVIELFSGIGAQAEALKELGLDYEVVATSDIDKHANLGYEAIHGKANNLGDITRIEHLPECDLLTYSYPCTSISLAGKREGMKEGSGTASSLLWEVGRLLKDMEERGCLPEVLLMENVDAVLNRVNRPEFDRWCGILADMGYCNSYQIMNAKDYGTPQNRKRIFMVSTLTMGEFIFPEPCPDGRVLRDVLEDDVPESYFLSEKRLATFKRHKERNDAKGNGFGFKIHEINDEQRERAEGDVSASVTNYADRYCATWLGLPEKDAKDKGIQITGRLTDYDYNQSGKVYDPDGVSSTIRTPTGGGVIPKIEITGELDRKFVQERDVISADGISKTVTANHHSSLSAVKVEVSDRIESVGELDIPGWHRHAKEVIGTNGPAPCISTQSNNLKTKILIEGELTDSNFIGSRRVISPDGVAPTVKAEHEGPNFTKVILNDGDKGKNK